MVMPIAMGYAPLLYSFTLNSFSLGKSLEWQLFFTFIPHIAFWVFASIYNIFPLQCSNAVCRVRVIAQHRIFPTETWPFIFAPLNHPFVLLLSWPSWPVTYNAYTNPYYCIYTAPGLSSMHPSSLWPQRRRRGVIPSRTSTAHQQSEHIA